MKRSVFIILLTALVILTYAQQPEPVSWSTRVKKTDPETVEIRLEATISKSWHIYSQTTPAGGPLPTNLKLSRNPLIIAQGGFKEVGNLLKKKEEVFGIDVFYYEDSVAFVQQVKLKTKAGTSVSATVKYMVCNDHECIPVTRQLTVLL